MKKLFLAFALVIFSIHFQPLLVAMEHQTTQTVPLSILNEIYSKALFLITSLEEQEATRQQMQELEETINDTLQILEIEDVQKINQNQLPEGFIATLQAIQASASKQYGPLSQVINQLLAKIQSLRLLIPLDQLHELRLCPLFQDLDDQILASVNQERQKHGLSKISRTTPCIKDLGIANGNQRTLVQLNAINQFNPLISAHFGNASCGLQVLRNSILLTRYLETQDLTHLRNINNIEACPVELANLKLPPDIQTQWLTTQDMERIIKENPDFFNNVSLIFLNNVIWDLTPEITAKIQAGLNQNNFAQIFLIGTEDDDQAQLEGRVHYFTFAIFKHNNTIQYVIIDTAPAAYHLDENSHNYKRLQYIIQMLETGRSNIKLSAFQ